MYSYYNYQELVRQTDELIADILKAINGEYSSIHCYQKLAQMAPSEKEKKQILEIREDEMRHYQNFTQLYVAMTGKQPKVAVTEECPNTYKEGIEFALIDEQNTVDFYHSVADKATDVTIKHAFNRAAADEQNHAVWFLYFFTKHR